MVERQPEKRSVENQVLEILDGASELREPRLEALHGRRPDAAAEIDAVVAAHDRASGTSDSCLRPLRSAQGNAVDPLALEAGRVIGGYRLVRLIGKGGMGQVWEAVDPKLRRPIALKLMLPGRAASDVGRLFFAREGRAGGRITHPGVVVVHHAGEDDGIAFIAQELVEGCCSFADTIDRHRGTTDLPPDYYREIAGFLAETADALEAAHAAGVVHRDVKPQNILVTPDAHPKVTDFGLARISDEPSISQMGDLAGTYAYMSPEQVTLKHLRVDHRTDIYSLGVVLYEALTLVRPFAGDTTQQIVQKILFEDPPDPRLVRSKTPRDLAVIVRRAMEKNPQRRFLSMAEFAADLRRFEAGEPIVSRPAGVLVRGGKWVRRHPTATTVLAAAGTLLAVLGAAVVLLAQARAETQRSLVFAKAEASRATEFNDFVVQMFNFAMPELGSRYRDLTVRDLVQRAERLASSWPSLTSSSGAMNHVLIGNLWIGVGDDEAAKRQLDTARTILDAAGDEPQTLLARGWASLHLSRLAARMDQEEEIERQARLSMAAFDRLPLEGSRYGLYPRAWLSTCLFQDGRRQEAYDLMIDAFVSARRYSAPETDRQLMVAELERMVDQVNDLWYGGQRDAAHAVLGRYCEGFRVALGYDPLIPMGVAAVAMYLDYYRGDEVRAQPLYRCCARLSREQLGETHPVTVMLARLASEAVTSSGLDASLTAAFQETAQRAYGSDHKDKVEADLLVARQVLEASPYAEGKAAFLAALTKAEATLGAEHNSVIHGRLQLIMSMPPFRMVEELKRKELAAEEAECLRVAKSQAELCWDKKPRRDFVVGHAIMVYLAGLARVRALPAELRRERETWPPRLVEARKAHSGEGSSGVLDALIWCAVSVPASDPDRLERMIAESEATAGALTKRTPTDVLELAGTVGALGRYSRFHVRWGDSAVALRWLNEAERILLAANQDPTWKTESVMFGLADAFLSAHRWDHALAMFERVPDQVLEAAAGPMLDVAVEVGRRLVAKSDPRGEALLSKARESGDRDMTVRVDLVRARRKLETSDRAAAIAILDDLHTGLTKDADGLTSLATGSLGALAEIETSLGRVDRSEAFRAAVAAKLADMRAKDAEREAARNEAARKAR